MEMNKWLEEIKQKGTALVEMGRLKVKKVGLEKRIEKLHCRIGERIDYLERLGRSFDEDEIVKGLISEIRNVEKEIEEIDAKISALKQHQEETTGGDSSDQEVSG